MFSDFLDIIFSGKCIQMGKVYPPLYCKICITKIHSILHISFIQGYSSFAISDSWSWLRILQYILYLNNNFPPDYLISDLSLKERKPLIIVNSIFIKPQPWSMFMWHTFDLICLVQPIHILHLILTVSLLLNQGHQGLPLVVNLKQKTTFAFKISNKILFFNTQFTLLICLEVITCVLGISGIDLHHIITYELIGPSQTEIT